MIVWLSRVVAITALSISLISGNSLALCDTARVPILLYHSWQRNGCDYSGNAAIALRQDLEMLHQRGYVVVPAYWIAEWVAGLRDGSTLPAKVVGLTFDDGADLDWIDGNGPYDICKWSFRSVLQDFKARHPELPWYSPHAASFVIASPQARATISGNSQNDFWWGAANSSGIMEIYNHGMDHDHDSIPYAMWDAAVSAWLPVGAYGDNDWHGRANFYRIDSYWESNYEVSRAASYIKTKIGVWPDLFAYPYGHASSYLAGYYFPSYWVEHQSLAAFCLGGTYLTKSSPRYCLPRFSFGGDWTTPGGLASLLDVATSSSGCGTW
jgi:Polysaccharide deacetylase